MSAPESGLKKQKRRHWGPLAGIAAVLVFVVLMFLWVTGGTEDADLAPEGQRPAAPSPEAAGPEGATPEAPSTEGAMPEAPPEGDSAE